MCFSHDWVCVSTAKSNGDREKETSFLVLIETLLNQVQWANFFLYIYDIYIYIYRIYILVREDSWVAMKRNIPFGRYCLFQFHFQTAWVHPFSKFQRQPTVAPERERVLVNMARCPAARGRRAAEQNSDESRRDSLRDSACGSNGRCASKLHDAHAWKTTAIMTENTVHSYLLCISTSCTGRPQSALVLLSDSCASVTPHGPATPATSVVMTQFEGCQTNRGPTCWTDLKCLQDKCGGV